MKTRLLTGCYLALVAAGRLHGAAPTITGVVNGASYSVHLAPGTWAAIFGTSLATSTATADSVPLGTTLGGVTVSVGGIAAPLYYVSPTQINTVIPFEIAIPPDQTVPSTLTVPVVVTTSAGASTAFDVSLTRYAPALFSRDGSGTGAALAFDANFKPVSAIGTTPIVLYATGLGATDPVGSSSSGGVSVPPFNKITGPLSVVLGSEEATVTFAGLAPGFPGIYQLNVTPTNPQNHQVVLTQSTCTPFAGGGIVCTGASGTSQILTIGAGNSVTNIKGSIDGIYPATGANVAAEGANPNGTGTSAGISVLFTGANFTLDFDVVPNAKPFFVGAGGASVFVKPAEGTWQAILPAPPAATRNGDFSALFPSKVLDFTSCNSQGGNCSVFPNNIVPASRLDPVFLNALRTVPPADTVIGIGGTVSFSGKLAGNHFHWGSTVGFGSFLAIQWLGPSPYVRSATFTLVVDDLPVATTTAKYVAY